MSYQNSSISQELSVDALFGTQDIKGELPVDISDFFSEGSGIKLKGNFRLGFSSPAKVGMDNKKLIEKKKAIYDLTIDKRVQKIGDGNKLEKYDINKLPLYINDNLEKLRDWID